MNTPNRPNDPNAPQGGQPTGLPPQRLQVELPNNLSAVYSNAAIVSHTNSEVVIDFVQTMPNDPRVRVVSRMVMTLTNAKLFMNALKGNLDKYEGKFGEIPTPPTLADQLFSGVPKPTPDPEDGQS
jgi:hypothetical protein